MIARNNPTLLGCLPKEFLLNGGTLAELYDRYRIDVRRHGTFGNLVQFKYNQIESPMDVPLVQQCRGLILDEDEDWRVVAWPFKKFFNYGEPLAEPIDWATARVQEKLDGSLMILYWYGDAWHVATSRMPDADGTVHGTNMTFRQLFWRTWEEKGFALPIAMHRSYTFMFELTSPFNRVVVPHSKTDLHLIGMRSIWSGAEVPAQFRGAYNPVWELKLQNLDEVLQTFTEMDPLQQEGYVIVDGEYRRIKVKHPGYVALHHLKSSFTVRKLVEIVRSGESAEVLAHFPEWQRPFEQVTARYDALVAQLEQDHSELQSLKGNRKDFAMVARQSVWPAAHFLMLDGHAKSVKEALKGVHIDKMVEMLGAKGLKLEGAI